MRNASVRPELANRSNALDNRARIMRRVTVDGPVSVGIDVGSAKDATVMVRSRERHERSR
jgi:hypothetical protein